MIWARDSEGLTHEALADRIGLSEPTVTNIINDKRAPGFAALVGLALGLGIPSEFLLKREPEGVGDRRTPPGASPATAEPGKRRTGGRRR
jgi:transcriptional regulator with XRE-family HTH domain